MFAVLKPTVIKWVDRNDHLGIDYNSGDFTKDAIFHDLDISNIVGIGVRFVLIHISMQSDAAGRSSHWRTKGNVNDDNSAKFRTQSAGIPLDTDIWVYTDTTGSVEYLFDDALWPVINVVIRGWFE